MNSSNIETFNKFGLGNKLLLSMMINSHDPNQPNHLESGEHWDQGISMEEGSLASFSIRLDGGPQCWF